MMKNKLKLSNAEDFVDTIKEYAEITELTAPLLNTLIDKIIFRAMCKYLSLTLPNTH